MRAEPLTVPSGARNRPDYGFLLVGDPEVKGSGQPKRISISGLPVIEVIERLAFLTRPFICPLIVTDPGKGGQRAISTAAINSPGSCRRLLLSKAVNTSWCGARPISFTCVSAAGSILRFVEFST